MRDRLQELKDIMRRGNAGEEGENSEKENSMPLIVFSDSVREIKQDVAELRRRVQQLKVSVGDNQKWMNDKASPREGSQLPKNQRKELERELEEEKLAIGTMAKVIRNKLKSMKSSSSCRKQTPVLARIKEVQINSVLNELNEVLREYLNCLMYQRERSVKILQDMIEVKGGSTHDIDSLLEEGKFSIFTNNLLMNDMEEKSKLREAENRRDKILKIESTMLEVRNLFNELALIVDLQQEKVEEVEKLVDDNLARVESGKKKIFSATKKKKKMRYRKLVAGLICSCVILIVVILLTVI